MQTDTTAVISGLEDIRYGSLNWIVKLKMVCHIKIIITAGLVAMGWCSSVWAQGHMLDSIFGSQSVTWSGRSPDTAAAAPAYWVANDDKVGMPAGRKFEVDFANQFFQNSPKPHRGSWWIDTNLNLSAQKSIRLHVYVSEAASDRITLYFFGQMGSYSDHSFNLKPGLNVVEVNLAQFSWTGFTGTDGWHSIKHVQVSLWRKDGGSGRGVVTVSAAQSTSLVQTLDSIFGSQFINWSGRIPDSAAVAPAYWVENNDGVGMPAGRKFKVDFSNQAIQYPNSHGDRGSWFINTNLNLSGQKSVKLFVYVEKGVEYLAGMTLYFFSTHSIRDQTFMLAEGLNILEVNLDEFNPKQWNPDEPTDGWHNITRVMVSLWERDNGVSWFTVGAVQNPNTVAVETRGNGIPFTPPPGDYSTRIQVRNVNGELLESRMIFDEEYYIADPTNPSRPDYRDRAGVTNVLNRAQGAGFNVYMPSAWLGGGRNYRTISSGLFSFDVPLARIYKERIEREDPLEKLITEAHKRKMEVHPSFTIAQRYDGILPHFSEPGSPVPAPGRDSSFDLANPDFRDFIVNLIVDFVRHYDVDGINLDYIRTTGLSYSDIAANEYYDKYLSDINELRTLDNEVEWKRFRDFQAEIVNDIVYRVRKGIDALGKPRRIILSIAGDPQPRPATSDGSTLYLNNEGRNEWFWVQNGWVDVVYQMDYVRNPSTGKLASVQKSLTHGGDNLAFAKLLGTTDLINGVEGQLKARAGKELADQIEYFLTLHPGRGIGVYNYTGLVFDNNDQSKTLIERPFKERALPFWRVHKQGGYWIR